MNKVYVGVLVVLSAIGLAQEQKGVPLDSQVTILKLQHSLDEAEKADKDLYGRIAYYQTQCPSFRQLVESNNQLPASKAAVDTEKAKLQMGIEQIVKSMGYDAKVWTIDVSTFQLVRLPKQDKQEEKK